MTLITCCYTPTGIAISGDSRTTGVRTQTLPQAAAMAAAVQVQIPWVLSDSARKVFCLHERFAAATWGDAFVEGLPIAHHVNEFDLQTRSSVIDNTEAMVDTLMQYLRGYSPNPDSGFILAGYDGKVPSVFSFDIKTGAKKRWNVDAYGATTYGLFYGGDSDVLQRLLNTSQTQPPFALMNLQDAVDFTRHLVRTTIDQMRFEPRIASVGGHIDTLTLTPARTKFLAKRELRISN
jgi:hypothetical protein